MGGNIKGVALSFSGSEEGSNTNFPEDFFLKPIDQIWSSTRRNRIVLCLKLIQISPPKAEYIAARIKLRFYLQGREDIC